MHNTMHVASCVWNIIYACTLCMYIVHVYAHVISSMQTHDFINARIISEQHTCQIPATGTWHTLNLASPEHTHTQSKKRNTHIHSHLCHYITDHTHSHTHVHAHACKGGRYSSKYSHTLYIYSLRSHTCT